MLNFYVWMVQNMTHGVNINLPHGILIEFFQIKFKSIFRYVG